MTLMFHFVYSKCSALAQAGGRCLGIGKNLANPPRSPTMKRA
jgi:hypothetical protein